MAILTTYQKNSLIDDVIADEGDVSNRYFMGIGRSQVWDDTDTVPTETETGKEEQDFRQNLQAVKLIGDVNKVVPRYNWQNGTIYSGYTTSSKYPSAPFYVLTPDDEVHVCVEAAKSSTGAAIASSFVPSSDASYAIQSYADGYKWLYLYTLISSEKSKYLSASYMPVKTDASAASGATGGQIGNIEITNEGSGYTAATVTITGDGSNATASATVSGGKVVKITMTNHGSNYTYAAAIISDPSSGTTATARCNIAPAAGFADNPEVTLKSTAVMFNADADGDEGNEFIEGNDFRQVGIIRNPRTPGNSLFTSPAGRTLTKLNFTDGAEAATFTQDNLVVGNTSGARAYIDFVDSAGAPGMFVHQTDVTGYESFDSDETVTSENLAGAVVTGSGTLTSSATTDPTVDPFSGDVLYIDNRAAIDRSVGERQNIKIVFQL